MENGQMHAEGKLISDANEQRSLVRTFCMVVAKELSEGTRGSPYKTVHANIGSRGLFSTTVLVSATGRVLATQPEKYT